jgi:hypothetical protein
MNLKKQSKMFHEVMVTINDNPIMINSTPQHLIIMIYRERERGGRERGRERERREEGERDEIVKSY